MHKHSDIIENLLLTQLCRNGFFTNYSIFRQFYANRKRNYQINYTNSIHLHWVLLLRRRHWFNFLDSGSGNYGTFLQTYWSTNYHDCTFHSHGNFSLFINLTTRKIGRLYLFDFYYHEFNQLCLCVLQRSRD